MVATTRTLTWPAVAGATSYSIVADDQNLDTATASPYVYTAEENSAHDLQIAGTNDGGVGPLCAKVHTTMPNAPPPTPTNLRVGDVTRGNFTVTFNYDNKPADWVTYEVGATSGTPTADDSTKSITVIGAADSTSVTVTIKAVDSGGLKSTTAASIKVTTPPSPVPGAPAVPTAFGVTHVGYSSITWAWNSVATATSYQVSTNGSSWTSTGTARTYTRSGLAESTRYVLYVRAVNAGGAGGSAGKAVDTLPKIKTTTPVYATRYYGYQQPNTWGPVGVSHYQSGVSSVNDNWAGQANLVNWIYTLDNDLQSGPYSPQPWRWITFGMTLNCDSLNAVYGVWGYQGTFEWQAWDVNGTWVQTGRTTGGGTNALLGVGPNVKNALTGKRIARVRLYFYGWGASPGYFKLSEWAIQARVITGYTYTYNVA